MDAIADDTSMAEPDQNNSLMCIKPQKCITDIIDEDNKWEFVKLEKETQN